MRFIQTRDGPRIRIKLNKLMIEHITRHFPLLTPGQKEQFATMMRLYPEWNAKINVISRKDIDNLEVNHILHSLAIGKFVNFTPGTRILDFGTGGGFPGLPLAVLFPEVSFHLVDRTGKKIRVAREIAEECGLTNVTFQHGDVSECKDKFDFVVSRAVMPQVDLIKICRRNISGRQQNALPNGLITLKGGTLDNELKTIKSKSEIVELSNWFDEDYFKTKKVVYTSVEG